MEIYALLFSFQAEHAGGGGAARRTLHVPAGATVGQAVERLRAELPGLPWPAATMVAVNQAYAGLSHVLHDGDELAVIPPVSGG